MKSSSLQIINNFHAGARELRAHFERRFADPRRATSDRFVWDWWHVPGQYTSLRTPAYEFFPEAMYERLHRVLVQWGRETLGAHDVSPPWLSCYVEGCKQELHGDLPHGPWAFVYSLTPWRSRRFSGGETLIVRDEVLAHWESTGASRSGHGLELGDIVSAVPAQFNRLTVFDPRVPHGVREVRGASGVLDGRLVVHGWFVQPRPFIRGPMAESELEEFIEGLGPALGTAVGDVGASGVLSFRFTVGRSGRARGLKALASTLRSAPAEDAVRARRQVSRALLDAVERARFRPRKAESFVTLPLIFES